MDERLTPAQRQAVENTGGRLLVSAAAGSGKTKVLVDRLLRQILDPVNPANLDEFLIITYTKAAASELRGKIAAKLSETIAMQPDNSHLQKQMQRLFLTKISTVHGFCGDVLREYAYRLELAADFRVGDENECREIRENVLENLLDAAYQNLEENPGFAAFVDSQGFGRDDRLVPQLVERVYDSARCHLNPEAWLDACLQSAEADCDPSQLPWGSFLMAQLREVLGCHKQALKQCLGEAECYPEYEKVAILLKNTIFQLEELEKGEKWDDIARYPAIDYGRLSFPRKNNPDPELCERIKAANAACKEGIKRIRKYFADDAAQVLRDCQGGAESTAALIDLVRQFDRHFSQAKARRRILDFSDLEHKTLDLLLGKSRQNPSGVAGELGSRYREILVDEYQDSNAVQDAIFTVLTREKQNCFLVGDVKQSIYQFRLADPGIFLEKYHSFLPAEEAVAGQGRKVLLSHNFRSGPEVIEAVNQVFTACMRPKVGGLFYGPEEALREGVPHIPLPGGGVELYALETDEDAYDDEANFIARRIRQMLDGGTQIRKGEGFGPVQPGDIVILLRSPGSGAAAIQRALGKQGIRCQSGGGTDLFKTAEISVLRALLETVQNPRQDIPLLAAIASPVFGFTADELAQVRSQKKNGNLYEALLESPLPRAKKFLEILRTLRQEARMDSLTGFLKTCFCLTRMDSIYGALPGGAGKVKNLQQFFQIAAEYEGGSAGDLPRFLQYLQAQEGRGLQQAAGDSGDSVSIMSIHKSKGLEFPVVFLANLSRKFNQESLRGQILCDRELGLGLNVADKENRIRYPSVAKNAIAVKMAAESVSEELRVLYVAMTRARDRLVMTYAAKGLQKELQEIALRLDFDGGELLCREALCPGDWVLLAAMQRMEAGALHALGGRPKQLQISEYPWKIDLCQGAAAGQACTPEPEKTAPLSAVDRQRLADALQFHYPYPAAVEAPSKQTATGRKGRFRDEEAAEDTRQEKQISRSFRSPSFRKAAPGGAAYGSAIHGALQYVRYENCGSLADTKAEIARLVEGGFLTQEQGKLVNAQKIADFFQTELGWKLRSGVSCIREFKFSILDDGRHYHPDLAGEQVLLQGVVDCALLEEDGIIVVDFKTDRVTEESLGAVVKRYRPQLETYAEALARIYEKPVKAKYLYFFHLDRLIPLDTLL